MATAGYAIRLNGTTQYATVADSAHHDYATGNAFTFGISFFLDYDYESTPPGEVYLWDRANQHSCYIESGEIIYYINGASGAVTYRTGIRVVPQKAYQLVVTGSESTNTTLNFYLNGVLEDTETLTGGMPADTDTVLYLGAYRTPSLYMKGSLYEWFQSNTTAFSAANVTTAWNNGLTDIDTVEAITGLIDNIGFEELTGTTYAGGKSGSVSGAGQGTPLWARYGDLGMRTHSLSLELSAVGQVWSGRLKLAHIAWEGEDIADGDECELVDINDRAVWHAFSPAADTGDEQAFDGITFLNGIKVKTLGHGYVHVYLR